MSGEPSPSSSSSRPAAPQLLFDDGSRVMQQAQTDSAAAREILESTQRVYSQTRGSLPLGKYYEIDRLVGEIQKLCSSSRTSSTTWRNRIALQFPDELLVDAPDVCWELEQALLLAGEQSVTVSNDSSTNSTKNDPLVFCLGDTTYQSCCPDLVAAAHLQADCLIHFGHACLSNNVNSAAAAAAASSSSSCTRIPVLYSFGRAEIDVDQVAEQVLQEIQKSRESNEEDEESKEKQVHRILLLSEVRYVYAMKDLQERLSASSSHGNVQVAVGRIPENRISLSSSSSSSHDPPSPKSATAAAAAAAAACASRSCCQNANGNDQAEETCKTPSSEFKTATTREEKLLTAQEHGFIVGGLELPKELENWASCPFTLLFVGSDESRQYLNIVLRFLSSTTNDQQQQLSPTNYWTWDPTTRSLSTQLSPRFKRQLNRRFYLVQKARLSNVFGLLVANLSDVYMRSVVHSLRSLIEQRQHQQQKACYTFVVGKINPAKISNFAEIDCFVMVACPEHSLLLAQEEREYPVPVITPLELSMALGVTEWGTVAYSLDTHDYLQQQQYKGTTMTQESDDEDEDSDAPYFNPVTGQYESSVMQQHPDGEELNLAALPGQGTLTKYSSAAADFLKQREYQGLQVDAGETKVKPAIAGQQGIASNYGER